VDVLERERANANNQLVNASAKLESFKRRKRISSLADQTHTALDSKKIIDETRNAAEAQLRDVNAQLGSVQQVLARTPATREIREVSTQTLLLDKLRGEVADLRGQLAKELTIHTDEHPNVQRLKQQLSDAEGRLQTESSRMSTSVKVVPNVDRDTLTTRQRDLLNQRDGLVARLASLNSQQQQVTAQVNQFSGADVELNLLTQHYTEAETRLNAVAARLGQVRNVADLLGSGAPIAVVDRAGAHNPPVDLSRGRTIRLSAIAFAMSLVMCMALAVGLELADRRVKTVQDAETLIRLPVVSVVPQLTGRASAGSICLTAENDPASHLAEAYHFLANHILRQTLRRENTVLMGATARPGQGATTALSNLAIALARAGRQVVLVEADLRRPFLHEAFDCEHKPGLTDVLQGRVPVREALSPTQVENLKLLAGGTIVADPWSLLWQPSMGRTIEELRQAADYVIFNVPSATVFADAMCVAPHVDGAVLVMRTSEMPNGAEEKVRQWLEEVEVPVMGVVLNGVPTRDMESFDFHRTYSARRADVPTPALQAPVAPPVRRAA
jgi:capsular exopolysaccharide synthesis family protein